MKRTMKKSLLALALAMPLLFTQGCVKDKNTAWWLAAPWAPLEWIWVPADMVPDDATGGGGMGGVGG
jgi:hypothetical protein